MQTKNIPARHVEFNNALATRDVAAYLAFLDDNCTLQINNAMPVYSKLAIETAYRAYLETFEALTIEIMATFDDGPRSVFEALYTYRCNDGSTEVVQLASLIDRNERGLMTAIRVYGDGTRVFKPFMKPRG